MGFQSGLSGLNASAKNIDIIGNNVANANTVGFKSSRAIFADVFASSLAGGGAGNVGIGVKVAQVQQEFTQGNITVTNSPLDLAINGRGFFRFDSNGSAAYSRNGQMHLDGSGYIVNSDGLRLTGYTVDNLNNIVASAPVPLKLATADIDPSATTQMAGTLNLDSRSTPIAAAFNPTNVATYTSSTSSAIFDSLGNSHALTMYFVKTATPGQWNMHATVDGGPVAGVDLGAGAGNPVTLNFNSSGTLTTTQPMTGVQLTVGGGAVTPLAMQMDFTGTSQFGADFGVTTLSQNGYTSGRLTGFDVSDNGLVSGRYTNGQANTLGQVVLANFANPQGLRSMGDNLWQETSESGGPVIGSPQSGSLGSLQSASVEDSNVDLTQELVAMITAQRSYQANAQTIKTQDQVLQTIVNLR
ncbi:MAG: flagellar hook protein FlgE [Betaproteobacteria bacterium]|jgi:flagellar hook protein FlgE|nr:flagellar hook protein FlgE [Betaproteobacteria bacterium]